MKECKDYKYDCSDCPVLDECLKVNVYSTTKIDARRRALLDVYNKGRTDILREHREQCQGKCFKCEVSVPFINSDGEEVILPYSYSYKTDCEDNRYINAKEVLSLIKQARADAIDEIVKLMKPCNNCPSYPNECNDTDYFEDCCRTEQSISWEDLRKLAEQLKSQD